MLNDREKMRAALEIIMKNNHMRNDLEAYLFYIARWGLGKGPKPNPKHFGIEE